MASNAYLLERPTGVSCDGVVVTDRVYQRIQCEEEAGHFRARRLPGPLTIHAEDSDSTDCLWTGLSDCLLNVKVIDEMRGRGYSGFETEAVNLVGRSMTCIEYAQFIPAGWGGVAPESSGIREIYRCSSCGHLKYSALTRPEFLFDARQWDGSDVLMIWPMPKFIFITHRVVVLLRALGVSGVNVVPTEAMDINEYGFTPGRLSHWMPSDRARRLGEASGIA